jgi:hypothetical protein
VPRQDGQRTPPVPTGPPEAPYVACPCRRDPSPSFTLRAVAQEYGGAASRLHGHRAHLDVSRADARRERWRRASGRARPRSGRGAPLDLARRLGARAAQRGTRSGEPLHAVSGAGARARARPATSGARPTAPSIRASERWCAPTGCARAGALPTAEERARALATGGFASLDLEGRRRRAPARGLVLEEGGFGKGIGLDAALDALRAARRDVGRGRPRRAARDPPARTRRPGPLRRGRPARPRATRGRDRARGGSLSTSGNSERGIMVDGRARRPHPRPAQRRARGRLRQRDRVGGERPATRTRSPRAVRLGPDAGLDWAAAHPGVRGPVPRGRRRRGLRARATAGLAARLKVLDPARGLPRRRGRTAGRDRGRRPRSRGRARPAGSSRRPRPDEPRRACRASRHQVEALGYGGRALLARRPRPAGGRELQRARPGGLEGLREGPGPLDRRLRRGLYRTFSGDEPAEWDMLARRLLLRLQVQ